MIEERKLPSSRRGTKKGRPVEPVFAGVNSRGLVDLMHTESLVGRASDHERCLASSMSGCSKAVA